MPVPSPGTSTSLLEPARAGAAGAWERLVEMYAPLLEVWLTAAGLQPADREDLSQRVLEILVRRLPDFEHNGRTGAFRAWLRAIVAAGVLSVVILFACVMVSGAIAVATLFFWPAANKPSQVIETEQTKPPDPVPLPFNPEPQGENPITGNDPAEQAAIDVIQKHGGFVVQDNKLPNNPVVEVTVFRPGFTDADLKTLASLTKLRKMNLANTKITGAGFKDLTGLKNLTALEVSQTPVNDDGLKAIAGLTQLKILAMRGTKATDPGLREMAPLTQLEELAVSQSRERGHSGAVNIAANLKQLKRLYIDNSSVGDTGVIEVAKLPNLQLLTINGTRVTDTGLEALTKVPSLEELHLSHFNVTDKSTTILVRCKNLHVLHLFDTGITDKGLQNLGKLTQLKKLDLTFSRKLSNQAIADFIKAHPNCTVKK
jgi:hypothetical protein